MKMEDFILEGERVILSPLQNSYIPELFAAVDSPEIWTYLPSEMKSIEDMTNHVMDALKAKESGAEMPFVVFDKEEDKIVGITRLLNISLENRSLEIGWTWYSSKVWRTSVNTECKYLLLCHCFETLNMMRVQFKVDSRNTRSNQAVSRIGATKEGVLRMDRILYDGYVRDTVYYSILHKEWPGVKSKLENFLSRNAPRYIKA